MFRTIAVEREYGCGAANISKRLAERLGWTLWDREITCELARRLKCDISAVERREERLDPTFYRLMKVFMRGSYESSFQGGADIELLDAEHLSILVGKVVNKIADGGNAVIVGRAAPWMLRERGDTFRLFLYAPYEEKLRRTLAQGQSQQDAESLLETVDRERAAFVKKYYGKEWPVRAIYHMMINSEMGDELVIESVVSQMQLLRGKAEVLTGPRP